MPYKNETGKPLYLNADKSKVVEEGAEAAFVLAGPGGEVPDAEAEKYGLGARKEKAQPPAENKQVAQPPADKAVRSADTKTR